MLQCKFSQNCTLHVSTETQLRWGNRVHSRYVRWSFLRLLCGFWPSLQDADTDRTSLYAVYAERASDSWPPRHSIEPTGTTDLQQPHCQPASRFWFTASIASIHCKKSLRVRVQAQKNTESYSYFWLCNARSAGFYLIGYVWDYMV